MQSTTSQSPTGRRKPAGDELGSAPFAPLPFSTDKPTSHLPNTSAGRLGVSLMPESETVRVPSSLDQALENCCSGIEQLVLPQLPEPPNDHRPTRPRSKENPTPTEPRNNEGPRPSKNSLTHGPTSSRTYSNNSDGDSNDSRISKTKKTYQCTKNNCGKTFGGSAELALHKNSVHTNRPAIELFNCPHEGCERAGESGFKRKDNLVQHLRGVHGDFIGTKSERRSATTRMSPRSCASSTSVGSAQMAIRYDQFWQGQLQESSSLIDPQPVENPPFSKVISESNWASAGPLERVSAHNQDQPRVSVDPPGLFPEPALVQYPPPSVEQLFPELSPEKSFLTQQVPNHHLSSYGSEKALAGPSSTRGGRRRSVSSPAPSPSSQAGIYSQRKYSNPEGNPNNSKVTKTKKTYRCTENNCGKIFGRSAELKRHENSVHKNEGAPPDYPHQGCERVGESGFKRKDNLVQHLRSVHGDFIGKKSGRRSATMGTNPRSSASNAGRGPHTMAAGCEQFSQGQQQEPLFYMNQNSEMEGELGFHQVSEEFWEGVEIYPPEG